MDKRLLVAALLASSCMHETVVHRQVEVRESVDTVSRKDDAPAEPASPPPDAYAPAEREAFASASDAVLAGPAAKVASGAASRSSWIPRSPGVQAGSSDDNLGFDAFVRFLRENGRLGLPHEVASRVVLEVRDGQELPIFGAEVTVRDGQGRVVARRTTFADGRALVFPGALRGGTIEVAWGEERQTLPLAGPPRRAIRLDGRRSEVQGRIPLDIAFVIDTTGSMQDEIDRLRGTLDVIHFQLTHLDPGADIRFGLVEYKDRGDAFVTRPIAFTADLAAFRAQLQSLRAFGGGDEPEDVQAGLEQALHGLRWRQEAVKVAFLIGDAAPHLDYGEQFTYVDAMHEAARRGIKIAAVGCSGLSLQGEGVWREIAQYTMAPYVFLSRGERGDMEGSASTVSHHVGSNWAQENLETVVVRIVKEEIAHLSPKLVARGE